MNDNTTPRETDRAVPEPGDDDVDVFDAADSDSWPPPEMKDAPFIRYLHKVMKYHQPTITPQECWVAIGAVRMWMSQNPDRASEALQAAVEPAADVVERAAKAMFTLEKDASGALVQWDDLLDNYGRNGVAGKAVYRDLARAALQAAAVEPEPGLDELLDSVSPEATVSLHYVSMPMADDPDPYWRAQVRVPLAGFVGNHMYEGTGATRMAAIADAVRQAKEVGNE